MQDLTIFQNCLPCHYAPLAFAPYFPLFNYSFHPAPEPFTFLYNPHSYSFSPEIEKSDHTLTPLCSPDSHSDFLPQELPEWGAGEKRGRAERGAAKGQPEQKENRNVYSNILRNFFRKVNDHAKIETLVQRIIAKHRLSLTPHQFQDHVRRLKVNHGKYLRFKKLRSVFVDQDLKEHSLIFRALFNYLANEEQLLQTLTSRKIGRWSVVLHLKGARELHHKLYQ